MKLVLGSQSPRRADVIRRIAPAGMAVEIIPADIDEKDPKYHRPASPTLTALSRLTLQLALDKNTAVAGKVRGSAVIVTADCVALCNGELREKPEDEAELRRFLASYQQQPVTAVASIWVHNTRTGWSGSAIDNATVLFHPFHDRVDAIAADRLFYDSAGGFLIEHPLMADRISHIAGDPETVHGMSGTLAGKLIADAMRRQ